MVERVYGDQNFRFSQVTESVFVTPVGADGENEVSKSNPLPISFGDSSSLDSFGRLRVSMSHTLFDSQQEYGLDTLRIWDAAANGTLSYSTGASDGSITDGAGNSVGPRNANTRMVPITCSATNGHYSILQSRQYIWYIPGKSHLVFMTGIFATGASATASFVRRTSTSGSVVDNSVAQASWNIDKMDGTGVSGINIDFTKTQILFISAQWLGVGRVIVGFDVDGVLAPAHEFLNANSLTLPYTQSFNLPVRFEAQTVTTTTVASVGYFDNANGIFLKTVTPVAGGTINFVCCSVQTEAGEELRGFPISASNGVTTIGVTTRRPILSIRPKATYNSLTNRAHIDLEEIAVTAQTNAAYWELVIGGTLTGASFASVGAGSIAESDVAATAITGGVSIIKGFVVAGSGSSKGSSTGKLDLRGSLTISQINALAVTQPIVSLVCTSFSGTSNLSGAFNWHEQVI
jgi:hypothetical protein